MNMTLGSLFAGIGGFELAASWAGIEPIWSNEIDKFCCKVLNKNFNHEIIEKDIKEIGKHNLKRVDIISGGFPCQPFSHAGKRKGQADNRYLWPEMLRIIKELQPTYVIGENVAGLLSMENGETLKRILSDLENEGYNNEIFIIPACSKGAWHRRDRIWIISNNDSFRQLQQNSIYTRFDRKQSENKINKQYTDTNAIKSIHKNVSDTNSKRFKIGIKFQKRKKIQQLNGNDIGNGKYWEVEPGMGRVVNGISGRVDRLKGLGNAIVPQIAYELFKAIKTINKL